LLARFSAAEHSGDSELGLVGRPVPITEIEGTFEDANNIVVGLLAPSMSVSDCYQMRVTDLGKDKVADLWTPDAV
jgi:hypothetical protein